MHEPVNAQPPRRAPRGTRGCASGVDKLGDVTAAQLVHAQWQMNEPTWLDPMDASRACHHRRDIPRVLPTGAGARRVLAAIRMPAPLAGPSAARTLGVRRCGGPGPCSTNIRSSQGSTRADGARSPPSRRSTSLMTQRPDRRRSRPASGQAAPGGGRVGRGRPRHGPGWLVPAGRCAGCGAARVRVGS